MRSKSIRRNSRRRQLSTWVDDDSPPPPRPKLGPGEYLIRGSSHDATTFPYLVKVEPNRVLIHRHWYVHEGEEFANFDWGTVGTAVLEQTINNPLRVFLGYKDDEKDLTMGWNMLIQKTKNTFVYLGHPKLEFTLPDGDTIVDFGVSWTHGGSYWAPYLVGEKFLYMITSNRKIPLHHLFSDISMNLDLIANRHKAHPLDFHALGDRIW